MMVSTVGTSVLGNAVDPFDRGRLYKLANHAAGRLAADDATFLDSAVERARTEVLAADDKACRRLSAELNGIIAYEGELRRTGRRGIDQHVLVSTDTAAGNRAAKVIDEKIRARGGSSVVCPIKDLQTADLDLFRSGCSSLAREMWRLAGGSIRPGAGRDLVFNLTGGFKGVNAFVQTVALAFGAETIYVFETSDRLMHIPRLPMAFAANEEIARAFPIYRRMAVGERVTFAEAQSAGLSEPLILTDGETVTLSEYGDLFFPIAWAEIASKSLLPARSGRIRFTNAFRHQAEKLPPDRLKQVNDAIEALELRLEYKAEGQLKRHTFKPLQGNPKPPATHELYLWSDQDAGRAFFRQLPDGMWEAT